jgi:hypothetical protein
MLAQHPSICRASISGAWPVQHAIFKCLPGHADLLGYVIEWLCIWCSPAPPAVDLQVQLVAAR